MPGLIRSQRTINLSATGGEPDMSSIGTLFYADNMDAYTTATAMGDDSSGSLHMMPDPSPAANGIAVKTDEDEVISPGRGGSGKALRCKLAGPAGSAAKFYTYPENAGFAIPDNSTHYFQFYARFTSASPFFNNTTQLAIKFFEMWFRHAAGRIQSSTRYGGSGAGGYEYPGHSCGWQVLWLTEIDQLSTQPIGPYPTDLFDDGLWHRFTYAVKSHASSGNKDGFLRMWVDGVKILDRSAAAVNAYPTGATKPYCTLAELDDIPIQDTIAFVKFAEAQTTTTLAWTYDFDDFIWRYVP